MVRNYQRKTNRGMNFNWSEDNLLAAIRDIKSCRVTTNKASKLYNIPGATLRRYLKKDDVTNISGPYSSGAKFKSAGWNLISTTTQEEVLPDVPVLQDFPGTKALSACPEFDPSIIIKQEIIEAEMDPVMDPSTFAIGLQGSLLEESITPNIPKSCPNDTDALNTSENILDAKSFSEVTVPIKSVRSKVRKSTTKVATRSSKRFKKTNTGFQKVFVKKNGKRLPNTSDDDEGSRQPRDKFDSYAEFIASKLRDLDPRSCAFVQTAIADLIFEAELGRFLSEGDKSIFATKTSEILKNMPQDCENQT